MSSGRQRPRLCLAACALQSSPKPSVMWHGLQAWADRLEPLATMGESGIGDVCGAIGSATGGGAVEVSIHYNT